MERKIYFCGSIRGGREDQQIYEPLIAVLSKFGQVLTEHVADPTLSVLGEDGPTDTDIYERDMAWLGESDVVIAEVTVPSHGVGYEIARAEQLGKPVVCLCRVIEGRRLSAMLNGNGSLIRFFYMTLNDVELYLNAFFK